MGLDVNLYALGKVTDEQLQAANEFLLERHVVGFDENPLIRSSLPDRIEWCTISRFYGIGYERGYWPNIHHAIVCISAALPHCEVFYGNDCRDDGEKITRTMLNKLWEHWLGPDGRAYFIG